MDDRDWLTLKVLYEKMSITKTAQSLYMTQPSLTKRIQHIEKEFNLTIVHRSKKGVQFTPQGEYLAKCADEMLDRLRQIKETALNMEQEVVGTLRLGVSNYITLHKLPRLLQLFRERYPKVEFKVITGWSREVFNLLSNKQVHIAIIRGDYEWAENKSLLLEENVCVAYKENIQLQDLPALPRIEYETDTLLKVIIDQWWSRTFSQPPQIGMEVDKAETCKEMVLHGLGYGVLPNVLVAGHPELYRFDIQDPSGRPIVRKTWMFHHQQSMELKVVEAFSRFVGELDFEHDI